MQLSTRTKMFCGCALSFGEQPNTRTCPVCLGHPGTLPTLNAEAVHYGLMIALALGCEVAPRSIFHRKNYFYPDLPKGYQISQYDIPLAVGRRSSTVPGGPSVRIHRAHLEEDAAKLIHQGESGRIHGAGCVGRRLQPRRDAAGRDRHRAGPALGRRRARVPPAAAHDAEADRRLGREHGGGLAALRRERVGAQRPARTGYRTKTELKNMNSFRFVERGIEAEIARQIATWESGEHGGRRRRSTSTR